MQEWIGYVVSAICSGGIAWIATIKWTRKQAEADALKSMQDVYQELIEDLKVDREDLKRDNGALRNTLRELQDRISALENAMKESERKMDAMRPFMCSVTDCKNRRYHR